MTVFATVTAKSLVFLGATFVSILVDRFWLRLRLRFGSRRRLRRCWRRGTISVELEVAE